MRRIMQSHSAGNDSPALKSSLSCSSFEDLINRQQNTTVSTANSSLHYFPVHATPSTTVSTPRPSPSPPDAEDIRHRHYHHKTATCRKLDFHEHSSSPPPEEQDGVGSCSLSWGEGVPDFIVQQGLMKVEKRPAATLDEPSSPLPKSLSGNLLDLEASFTSHEEETIRRMVECGLPLTGHHHHEQQQHRPSFSPTTAAELSLVSASNSWDNDQRCDSWYSGSASMNSFDDPRAIEAVKEANSINNFPRFNVAAGEDSVDDNCYSSSTSISRMLEGRGERFFNSAFNEARRRGR